MTFIDKIAAELEEAQSDIRRALLRLAASDARGFREAMAAAHLRLEYAEALAKASEMEATPRKAAA